MSNSLDSERGGNTLQSSGCLEHSDQNTSNCLEVSHISHAESDPDSAEALHDQLYWAANLCNPESDSEGEPEVKATPEFLKQIMCKLAPTVECVDQKELSSQPDSLEISQY